MHSPSRPFSKEAPRRLAPLYETNKTEGAATFDIEVPAGKPAGRLQVSTSLAPRAGAAETSTARVQLPATASATASATQEHEHTHENPAPAFALVLALVLALGAIRRATWNEWTASESVAFVQDAELVLLESLGMQTLAVDGVVVGLHAKRKQRRKAWQKPQWCPQH